MTLKKSALRRLSARAQSSPQAKIARRRRAWSQDGLAMIKSIPGARDAADVTNREAAICWDVAV
jgi:hypothetical protein